MSNKPIKREDSDLPPRPVRKSLDPPHMPQVKLPNPDKQQITPLRISNLKELMDKKRSLSTQRQIFSDDFIQVAAFKENLAPNQMNQKKGDSQSHEEKSLKSQLDKTKNKLRLCEQTLKQKDIMIADILRHELEVQADRLKKEKDEAIKSLTQQLSKADQLVHELNHRVEVFQETLNKRDQKICELEKLKSRSPIRSRMITEFQSPTNQDSQDSKINALTQQLRDTQETNSRLRNENHDQIIQIKCLEEDLQRLKLRHTSEVERFSAQQDRDMKSKVKEAEQFQAQVQCLKNMLSISELSVKEQQEAIKLQEQRFQNYETQIKSYQDQLQEKNTQIDLTKQKILTQESQLKEMEQNFDQVNDQVENLKTQLIEVMQELSQAKKRYENDPERQSLSQQINELKTQLEKSEGEKVQLTNILETQHGLSKIFSKASTESLEQANERIFLLLKSLNDENSKIMWFTEQLALRDKIIQDNKRDFERKEEFIKSISDDRDVQYRMALTLQRQMKEYCAKYEQVDQRNAELDVENQLLKKVLEDMKRKSLTPLQ